MESLPLDRDAPEPQSVCIPSTPSAAYVCHPPGAIRRSGRRIAMVSQG